MKVSRQQVAENRRTILQAAGRLFRERGFEAVTVAEVMKAAGLTHGGFYGYFRSKDDLIAATLAAAADALPDTAPSIGDYAAFYLSPAHRENRAEGCFTAGLAAETLRQAPETRAPMTSALRRQIEGLSRRAPGDSPEAKRRAAIGAWSAMVGALILSRVSDDPALSDEILASTRAWLEVMGAEGEQQDDRQGHANGPEQE